MLTHVFTHSRKRAPRQLKTLCALGAFSYSIAAVFDAGAKEWTHCSVLSSLFYTKRCRGEEGLGDMALFSLIKEICLPRDRRREDLLCFSNVSVPHFDGY